MQYNPDVVKRYYEDNGIELVDEYLFSPDRNYRFDFAHLPSMTAIEIQGAIWKGGRGGHTSGAGYVRDMEKSNLAMSLGWRIIQCVPQDICMDEILELVKKTTEVSKNNG